MSVADRIDATRQQLTPAERRVADVVLLHPQAVAFGTVAELATRAATSGTTVVRLAAKLGFTGFTELQDVVQDELGHRLRPAAERIRKALPTDLLARSLAVELDNVHATLEDVDRTAFDKVVAGRPHPVVVTIDSKQYERWVLRAATDALALGALVVAFTDSTLSPLADLATYTFVSRLDGVGPFDSQVGTLADRS